MDMKERIRHNMENYIKAVTDTGTEKERNNEAFFTEWFKSQEYFKKNPENWGLYPIEKDSLGRHVPWGLLKGEGQDTVVLVHHSDTVDTQDYGKLSHLATDPQALMEHYAKNGVAMDAGSKKDLDSGNWIFGRGVCDMKGGGAIHMALMEEYCQKQDFKGNLLLIAVPDEENLSAGMRGAIHLLKALKEEHELNYILMMDVEPHERKKDDTGVLYQGAVGKLMPVVYVKGKLAHVGQVYSGLNPTNLLSEIIRKTEVSADFIESVGNTTTMPPTWLYAKDQKQVYDVSLPIAAAGYMNLLTLDRSLRDIFKQLREICLNAFNAVIDDVNNSYKRYRDISGLQLPDLQWKPKVLLFAEAAAEAERDAGDVYLEAMEKMTQHIKKAIASNEMTLIDGAYKMIETTLEHINDPSPMVIIALAPPYYPNVHNQMLAEKSKPINKATAMIMKYAKDTWGEAYEMQDYFTGLCDLSYAMFQADDQSISYIEENMLMWKEMYYIPLETIRELSMPIINLGPWGKDFHKYTERVYAPDLLERTPELIDRLLKDLLS